MTTFTPPNTNSYSLCPPDGDPLARRLMRFHGSEPRGENVYIINGTTVTTNDPDGVTVTWDMVTHVFWGGHVGETVTAAEATLLTDAGFGAYLT